MQSLLIITAVNSSRTTEIIISFNSRLVNTIFKIISAVRSKVMLSLFVCFVMVNYNEFTAKNIVINRKKTYGNMLVFLINLFEVSLGVK